MSIAFRPGPRLIACAAALLLCGCLVKDKSDKPLSSGGLMPPWDPAKFTPKRLEGYAFPGPESAFAVFQGIARLDSLGGDPKDWKPEADALDTLRLSQLLDTAFVFPQNPEATMPYGYDDSFRDDTLYRNAYGNGLFTQDHPCAATYVLSGQFLHPAKWLRTGLKQAEIIAALGTPRFRQEGVLRYLSHHPSEPPVRAEGDTLSTAADYSAFDVFEGVNFYFQEDSLFAAVLQKSQPCH
ncbi:MAG TPA: hypothetical protein VJ385_20565 [Fibrobacteria bacterium]|nr:hypothetical protein [Fibrobacteria bacterium]